MLKVKERIKNCIKDLKSSNDGSSSFLAMLPVVVFAAVVILIVRLYYYTIPDDQFPFLPTGGLTDAEDLYSLGKLMVIIASCFLMLLVGAKQLLTKKLTVKKLYIFYIPIVIYTVFVLISHFTSDYRELTLWGGAERFEGTIALVCYMLALFYVINVVKSEENVKQLICAVTVSLVLLSILGIFQGLGHDFFDTEIGLKIIVPNTALDDGYTAHRAIEELLNGEPFASGQDRVDYQTVYNPNNVAFYLVLVIPIIGMLFIRTWNKEANEPLWKKIGFGMLFAALICNFVFARTSGALIGLGIIGILGIIIFNKQLSKWIKPLCALLAITLVVLCSTNEDVLDEIYFANVNINDINYNPDEAEMSISYIDTIKDGVQIAINGKVYGLAITNNGVFSTKELPPGVEAKLIHNTADGQQYLCLTTNGFDWLFCETESGYKYLNPFGNLVDLDRVERSKFFYQRSYLFSIRGIIWADTVPLLKNTVVKGYGPDSFLYVFPQTDYAARYTLSKGDADAMKFLFDKPHNMYLMMGVTTGCISLIAMLFLYGTYIIQSIRLYWRRELKADYLLYVGSGIFFGVSGFVCAALLYDSTVSVMPLFYSMLGTGIAINEMIKRRDKEG